MLVRLGKLLDGEGKSKKDDIDIGVHDGSGALYTENDTFIDTLIYSLWLNGFQWNADSPSSLIMCESESESVQKIS